MNLLRRRLSLIFARLASFMMCGCGPAAPGLNDTGGSTSVASSTTGGTTDAPTSDGLTGTTGPGSSSEASPASTSGTTEDGSFVPKLDQPIQDSCNPLTQDCPPGQKCMPFADDGASSWNNDKCVPVMENPAQVHEPCVAEGGGFSGFDNCDLGLFCWDVDAEGNGHCVALCSGSMDEPSCSEPGHSCAISSESVLPLCLEVCDPLAQGCDASEVCIEGPGGTVFFCVLDASGTEGQAHDPCMGARECDAGLFCGYPDAAAECDQQVIGCCEPFCDISAPNTCPGQGQVCNSWYGGNRPPLMYENLGYCAVPE